MERLLAELLSIGIAAPALEVPLFTDEPKYPCYFYPKPAAGPYAQGEPYGMGLSADRVEAKAKALAEFYERLCLLNPRPTVASSVWTQDSGWVDPVSLAGPISPSQAAQLRRSAYSWLDATEVNSGRATKLPAQVVVPGFGPHEERILPAVGPGGASLGRRGDLGRLERGLFEVLERYTTGVLPFSERIRQRVVEFPTEFHAIEAQLRRYRLEPYVFALAGRYETPWVLVIVTDHSGLGPALSFATRCASTYCEAIRTAFIEVLERRRPARVEDGNREPRSTAPRVYPWETLETLAETEPQLKNAAATSYAALPDTPRTAAQVLECFEADGIDILSVDTTLPEVAAAGFEASKIVIPGLGPLPA